MRIDKSPDLSGRSKLLRTGLPSGSTVPDFHVTTAAGETVGLSDFQGRLVMLVFLDPECGPCADLFPRLVAVHRRIPEIPVLWISRRTSTTEPNPNHEPCPGIRVVYQHRWEVAAAFGTFATPTAFLIDEGGCTAGPMAAGADGILALLRAAGVIALLKE